MSEKYFQQPSVMTAQEHFAQVPSADIPRSKFDRSHAYKTTFDAGLLTPVFVDEVLPGDTFTLNATAFARLATPLKPVMDNMYLDMHFFFVPYRLVWDNWQQFMGERKTLTDDPNLYSMPQTVINMSTLAADDLAGYFGIPRQASGSISVSSLPFRAYALIWNEWYRDQNLQDPITINLTGTADSWGGVKCYRRGKRHDYFTSALPWPQKGTAVTIPLGTTAPVYGTGKALGLTADGTTNYGLAGTNGGSIGIKTGSYNQNSGTLNAASGLATNNAIGVVTSGVSGLYADLSTATAQTINALRTAFQIQKLLERDARGGTRYIELILSHFGVRSDDARLQRPEYLGGGTTRININPIASTTTITGATPVPQGNLAAVGTAVSNSGFQKSFTEHGIIIGLASARADLTYQNGVERFWSRKTRYDFYWPALSHLGEQAILNKEIFAQGTATDDLAFGYQERYAEYRYKPSRITGLFQSNQPAPLDVWHLAIDFASLPVLNASFIQDDPPIDRIIAVTTEPHFIADFWFDLKCDRPMPVYSVPGLIDHF